MVRAYSIVAACKLWFAVLRISLVGRKQTFMFRRILIASSLLTLGCSLARPALTQDLYVSSNGISAISRLHSDGTIDGTFHPTFSMATPYGMAFDTSGNLFVSHDIAEGGISKVAPDGTVSIFASGGIHYGRDLAIDTANNLYVVNRLDRNVLKFTPDGTSSIFAAFGTSEYTAGLTLDASDNLYVAVDGGDIKKVTPNGNVSVFASTGITYPDSPRFDHNGNLFVADYAGNNVRKIAANGTQSVFASVAQPNAVLFDSADNLYVSQDQSVIYKFTPDGTQTTFVSGLNRPIYMVFAPVPAPSALAAFLIGAVPGATVLLRRRRNRK